MGSDGHVGTATTGTGSDSEWAAGCHATLTPSAVYRILTQPGLTEAPSCTAVSGSTTHTHRGAANKPKSGVTVSAITL